MHEKTANHVTETGIDVVDEASKESFPASDSPGWATGQRYDGEPDDPARQIDDETDTPRRGDEVHREWAPSAGRGDAG